MGVEDKYFSYDKEHCWQHDIRLQNIKQDILESNLTVNEVNALKVSDFEFRYVDKSEKEMCKNIVDFIKRHEWLGKMPMRPTQRFIATYRGIIAGAIVLATPNSFSRLLGERTKDLEKLISRGACISWSPKNLASKLIMWSIHWMVK